jgi:hypothetical protein
MKRLGIALALALVACGGDSKTTPDDADPTVDVPPPREVHMSVQQLQPSELVEGLIIGGDPGDRAIIHLTAPTATLDWNIHAHPAGSTITVYEELRIMTATFDFIPSENTEWYLLLRNSGNVTMDVDVKVELFGAMTFEFI